MSPSLPRLSRRLFVRGSAAILAGALLPTPWLEGQVSARGISSSAFQVGVIVPRSIHAPAFARDLTAGLSLALSTNRNAPQLTTREVNGTLGDAARAAEELLQGGAHLLVAAIGTKAPAPVAALCEQYERPLIIMNAGADAVRSVADAPFTFHSTLNSWESSFALGQWAAKNAGARAVTAASFYDSGYDSLYAFEAGFTQAGGVIAATHISHRPLDKDGFQGLLAVVQAHQPDFLFAHYSGALANELLAQGAASLALPVLGAPFLTETVPARNVYSGGPWAPTLKSRPSEQFVRQYTNAMGAAPSSLALLGWDTGALITAALQNAGAYDGFALQAALRSASFVSPRGTVRMDSATQRLVGPLYLREGDGSQLQIRAELPAPASTALFNDGSEASGWITPYLT